MSAKFTPGPWKIASNATLGDGRSVYCKEVECWQNEVARCPVRHEVEFDRALDETDANAALIAAAPDLYAACEVVANELEQSDFARRDRRWCMAELRAALAKARGKQ